jgi:hypothetical protein
MRKILTLSLFAVSLFILGAAEPVRVPKETQSITIDVIDRAGKVHRLKGISCNGRSYLRVRKGSVEYSISLKSLKEIKVLESKGMDTSVRVVLLDGTSDNFKVSSSTICMSESKLGEASFYIKNIQSITFRHGEGK